MERIHAGRKILPFLPLLCLYICFPLFFPSLPSRTTAREPASLPGITLSFLVPLSPSSSRARYSFRICLSSSRFILRAANAPSLPPFSPSPTSSLPRNVAFNRASTLLAVVRNPRRFAATRVAEGRRVHRGNDAQIGRIISKTTTLPPPSPPPPPLAPLPPSSFIPSFILCLPCALFRTDSAPRYSRTLVADSRQGMEYNPHRHHRRRRRHRHRHHHRTTIPTATQPSTTSD